MKDDEVNRLLYETINSIYAIATSRVSIWSIEDKYAHVPFFRFRFKGHEHQEDLYKRLSNIIDRFKGNYTWSLGKNSSPLSSFIIAPSIYIGRLLKDKSVYRKEEFLNEMASEDYKTMVDKAIEDVPLLAEYIKGFW